MLVSQLLDKIYVNNTRIYDIIFWLSPIPVTHEDRNQPTICCGKERGLNKTQNLRCKVLHSTIIG